MIRRPGRMISPRRDPSSMYSFASSRRAVRQVLEVVGHARGIDALPQSLERQVVAQLLHDPVELPDVRRLIADRAHQESPVARLQLGGSEL